MKFQVSQPYRLDSDNIEIFFLGHELGSKPLQYIVRYEKGSLRFGGSRIIFWKEVLLGKTRGFGKLA